MKRPRVVKCGDCRQPFAANRKGPIASRCPRCRSADDLARNIARPGRGLPLRGDSATVAARNMLPPDFDA